MVVKLPSVMLLLLLALSGAVSEVIDNFIPRCQGFFAEGITPTVFTDDKYKRICQIRENTYEYATLYDTEKKIPVYSAYRFNGLNDCDRKGNWYIEPQLEGRNFDKHMSPEGKVGSKEHQAVNSDYASQHQKPSYERGHLAPVHHGTSQSCADATFTLTSAAPQNSSFNKGQWRKTERDVAKVLNSVCERYDHRYIVTGVVPGNKLPPLNNRVNIPSHFWTAYCCLDNNLKVKVSRGFIGENRNDPVQQMTVEDLENELADLYGKTVFTVFTESCYTSEYSHKDTLRRYVHEQLRLCKEEGRMESCRKFITMSRIYKELTRKRHFV